MKISKRAKYVIAALVVASCGYWEFRKSDYHREAVFRSHRAQYIAILGMLQKDKALRFLNGGLTDPSDPATAGISKERISEYRRGMADIECSSITYEPDYGSAYFSSSVFGAAGILYAPIQSKETAKKYGLPLDRPPPQARVIEGDWYLSSEDFDQEAHQ